MNKSCDVVSDLIPLVKDNVASKDSIELVLEHLESCESCKFKFESNALPIRKEIDDKRIIFSIKKKLLIAMSVLFLIGGFIGMTLNQDNFSFITTIIAVIGIVLVGILVYKFDIKGDGSMNRFFMGKAIGTIILFAILGIYLLLKYVLHLF